MKVIFIKLLAVLFYFTPINSFSETFSVMLYEGVNPPYVIIKNGQNTGIFIDLFAEISRLTNHEFVFKNYPVARALKEFDMGRVDIEPGVNEKWRQQRKVPGEYSIPYEQSREVIVFKEQNKIKVNSTKDLYGKNIGIVRGYSYPKFEQAFNDKLIYKVSNRSEALLLKQLQRDRIKYIFIGERTIKYYQQQSPQFNNIVIGDNVSQAEVKLRVHPDKAYVIPELNNALKQLMETGAIKKIYDKYQ